MNNRLETVEFNRKVGETPLTRYVDPTSRDYSIYSDHLFAYNSELQKKFANNLDLACEGANNISINTTGSDGRFEKGPASPIELLVFLNGERGYESFNSIKKRFAHTIAESADLRYLQGIDVKDLTNTEQFLTYFYFPNVSGEIISVPSPNRIFDAKNLFECPGMADIISKRFVDEIVSPKGKSLFERIKRRVKDHAGVSSTGIQNYKGQGIAHYNLDEGVAFYDPDTGLQSFKQGPLRAVQYALVRDKIKAIRNDNLDVLDLPQNTISQLNNLEVKGMNQISGSQISDLSDSYKYFLWLYHKSQWTKSCEGERSLEFDRDEVRDRLASVEDICKSQIIK